MVVQPAEPLYYHANWWDSISVTHSKATSYQMSTMAEKTILDKGSSFMDPFRGLLLTYFMPELCYDEFFLKFNFLDGKCLVLVKYGSSTTWKMHYSMYADHKLAAFILCGFHC